MKQMHHTAAHILYRVSTIHMYVRMTMIQSFMNLVPYTAVVICLSNHN